MNAYLELRNDLQDAIAFREWATAYQRTDTGDTFGDDRNTVSDMHHRFKPDMDVAVRRMKEGAGRLEGDPEGNENCTGTS
ncbi:hypothetical protein [Paraburkholderia elongata]|uniref:Uncharacterized protein n=1 Tax=Paraburkholderia elongata TaxID=2675747 RepID=A0A972NXU5_9BURK|nr:hypothetical protein [Paraburkholderia elongata]NPT59747.1 hypothetical protein [Paraburkholderia elongata]